MGALVAYFGAQIGRHGGRRELAFSIIARDLRMSPTQALRDTRLLCRAGVLQAVKHRHWRLTDEGRPRLPTTHWRAGDRLTEGLAQARRGPHALAAWLQALRDAWHRIVDHLRDCKDRVGSLSRAFPVSGAERPQGRDRSEWPPGGPAGPGVGPPAWVVTAMRQMFSRDGVPAGYIAAPCEAEPAEAPNTPDEHTAVLGDRAAMRQDRT